jgi:ATP-dependent RNA helicase DeaD
MAAELLNRFGPETVAAGFVRMWREGRSAPEVLSDQAGPAPSAPRERGEFGASVWFSISVGRSGRAEARWLLPKICDAGSIAKDGIGAIRVQEDVTFVQIGAAVADKFGQMMELDKGVIMERMAGEPNLDRPERPAYSARPERAERRDKPAYVAKPARVVEEGAEPAPARKPYAKREDSEAKPYTPRESKPYDPTDAKPYAPREQADRKPYAPRETKPYTPRAAAGAAKPYTKREDGDKKPYAPRDAKPSYAPRDAKPAYTQRDAKPFGAKPYAKRDDGAAKPYVKRDAADADRKPRWGADDKAAPKSAGYKSQAGAGKPARAAGYKSHAAEGAPARPREDSGEPKRTYAPKGDAARPFVKREGVGKAAGFKSHAADGKKPFARAKPAAPKTDAKDTSKRFVPPKAPKR